VRGAAAEGPVVSFDQMGPVSLRPTAGAGWAPKGRPRAAARDYNRRAGIRYVFAPTTFTPNRLRVRLRPRRAGTDMLTFMRQIRLAYPDRQRIYWIQDNLSANWIPPIRAYAAANRIELVATPTYASYLNRSNATSPRSASSSSATPTTSGLGRLRLRARPTHPPPQQRPPRPPHHRRRNQTPASPPDDITGPTKLQGPLDDASEAQLRLVESGVLDRFEDKDGRMSFKRRQVDFRLPTGSGDAAPLAHTSAAVR